MRKRLKEPGLRIAYVANIAMCIYDNRRSDGRLNKADCNELEIGAESGSQKILDMIHKDYKVTDIICAVEKCKSVGRCLLLVISIFSTNILF